MTKYTTLMMRSHHQSSILSHQGTLLSRLSRHNLKIALKRGRNM